MRQIAGLLSKAGLMQVARTLIARRGAFVLAVHDVIKERRSDLDPRAQYGLTVREMAQIITWLGRRFRFLTPNQFFEGAHGVLLTVDDGKANNYTNLLPLLEAHEMPAIWFVSTAHVNQPRDWLPATRTTAQIQWSNLDDVPDWAAWEYYNGMTPDQITACGQHPLITIGSHTISHPFLTQCSDAVLKHELVASKQQLEAITGREVNLFAYPTSDYDHRVAQAVESAGYAWAFALRRRGVCTLRYEIPRIDLYYADAPYLDAKLSGLFSRPVHVADLVKG